MSGGGGAWNSANRGWRRSPVLVLPSGVDSESTGKGATEENAT